MRFFICVRCLRLIAHRFTFERCNLESGLNKVKMRQGRAKKVYLQSWAENLTNEINCKFLWLLSQCFGDSQPLTVSETLEALQILEAAATARDETRTKRHIQVLSTPSKAPSFVELG